LSSKRLGSLQELRFWAALLVLLYHSAHYVHLRTGASGLLVDFFGKSPFGLGPVSVFFALSGFVISEAARETTLRDFVVARVLRIYPAFWVAVAAVVAVKLGVFGSFPFEAYDWRCLLLLPFGAIPYVLSIEWSLVYEIVFYALVAALIAVGQARRLWALAGLGILASVCTIALGFDATSLTPRGPEILVSALVIPFASGAMAHRLHLRRPTTDARLLLLAGLAYAAFALTSSSIATGLALGLGGALVVLVLAGRDATRSEPPSRARAIGAALGDRSYGLYLVHAALIDVIASKWLAGWALPGDVAMVLTIALVLPIGLAFGAAERALYRRLRALAVPVRRLSLLHDLRGSRG
jgi:peptidoglycan/LPS O-acetylase OafA/YrhL